MNVRHTTVLNQIYWTRWTSGRSRDDARSGPSWQVLVLSPRRRPPDGPRNAELPVVSFTAIERDASNRDGSQRMTPCIVTEALIYLKFEVYGSVLTIKVSLFGSSLAVGCDSERDHGPRCLIRITSFSCSERP